MPLFSKKPTERKSPAGTRRRSPVTTYYRSGSGAENPSPFSKKTPKRSPRRFLFGALDIILGTAAVLALGYSLMIKPAPNLIVSSQSFHSQAVYKSAAIAQLKHLSNRNKITFNSNDMAAALKQQYPEIASVDTELPLFSEKPTIRLTIDKASFFLNSGGERYVIDSSGRAIALAASLPQITNLPIIDDQSGYKTSPGLPVLSADSVAFINTVLAQCQRANVPIASLTLPAIAEEIDLRTKDQPYFVKFYFGGDVLSETGQFLAARQHFKDSGQTPGQYLDVRVAGKIFYK